MKSHRERNKEAAKCDYPLTDRDPLDGLDIGDDFPICGLESERRRSEYGKPPCCETTGSNTNAEHPKHSRDLDLLPPISCHSCRTTEDPQGLQKQTTKSPVPPPLHESVIRCMSACLLFVLLIRRRAVRRPCAGKCRVGSFHGSRGLDNKLVTGLPAPDVHRV